MKTKTNTKRKITLNDIAQEVGISVATASRALKIPKDKLKTAREKKIHEIAEAMGYFSNNSLSQGKKLFRILLSSCSFQSNWMKIMAETVNELGNVELNFKEFIGHNIDYSQYDGIICRHNDEFPDVQELPIVKLFGAVGEYCPFNVVTYNNPLIGRLAADECLTNDCDVFVSYYHHKEQLYIPHERIDAFHNTIKIHNPNAEIYKLNRIDHETLKIFEKIKEKGFKKIGIFCANDYDAYSLYCAISSYGMFKLYKDYILVGCDNDEDVLRKYDVKPITIDLKVKEIMTLAIKHLINLKLEQQAPIQTVTLVIPEIIK